MTVQSPKDDYGSHYLLSQRSSSPARLTELLYRHLGDLLGIGFILLVAVAYLSPSLKDGLAFGPTGIARQVSILTASQHLPHQIHNVTNGDIITQGVAWNTLDWNLVHHGQFPLWNSLSGTGLPQFLNFESAPMALPTLVGYLVPLKESYLVTMLVKLLIAGTGTYVVVRLLGGRPLSATLGGVTMMLSGPFSGWLGWSISGPLAWTGWIIAATILVYRSPPHQRAWRFALLAAATAFCIYGGFPEVYFLMAGALLLLLMGLGIAKQVGYQGVDWRGVGRIAIAFGIGLAFASPLWMPGIAILRNSIRASQIDSSGLPLHTISLLATQGYNGLPLATSRFPQGTFFGHANYFETAAYVGVIALVLAATCIGLAWRRPVVIGLVVCALGSTLVAYDLGTGAPVQHLISSLGLGNIALQRILSELTFAIAILAGLGLELLLRHWRKPQTRTVFVISIVLMALVVGLLWGHSHVGAVSVNGQLGRLTSAQATAVRRRSLYWPTFELVLLVAAAVGISLLARVRNRTTPGSDRRMRTLMGMLVALQAVFLIFAGVGINSYNVVSYPTTPAVSTLKSIVGSSLVGIDGPSTPCGHQNTSNQPCGLRAWNEVGLYPDVNIAYGIDEFALHDPITPLAYFDSFPVKNDDRNSQGTNLFAPAINSTALALLYGIRYVIVEAPLPIPTGMHLVKTIVASGTTVSIVSVPGSRRFSLGRTSNTNGKPTTGGKSASTSQQPHDQILRVAHPSDARYVLKLRTPAVNRLTIRITGTPGWHASANGHPIALHRSAGDLMSAIVPAGTRSVVLTYQPTLFQVGEDLAFLGFLGLIGYGLIEIKRRRTPARP